LAFLSVTKKKKVYIIDICSTSNGGLQKIVDVSALFVNVESFFPEVIDSLYVGKLAYSANFNQTLKNVYDSLDLKVDVHTFKSSRKPSHCYIGPELFFSHSYI
jgi:hypothetical protein